MRVQRRIRQRTKRKVKPRVKKPSFFKTLSEIPKKIEKEVEAEIEKLKKDGKIKEKFAEGYNNYVKRKERERKEPEHKKLKKMPTAKEIKKRALPVALKHEKKLMK